MLLEFEKGERFAWLFSRLLDYTNKKYDIIPGLDFSSRMPEDMGAVAVVKKYLWENDRIIDDYIKENPHNLNIAECDTVLKWKYHNTGTFFYVGEDDGYSIFSDENYYYCVSGHLKEIQDMLGTGNTGIPIETTLLAFEDAIVYDMTISEYSVAFGPNMMQDLIETYAHCKEENKIVKTGASFIEKMKVPKEKRPVQELAFFLAEDGPKLTEEERKQWAVQEKELQEEMAEELAESLYEAVTDRLIGAVSQKKPETSALKDILESRTKKQLMTIIRTLGITGASSYNKAELIDILTSELYKKEELVRNLAFYSQDEINFIDKVVEEKTVEINLEQAISIGINFLSSGIILFVYGRKEDFYVTVSDELADIYKEIMTEEYRERRKVEYLICNYATAATRIYGVISMDDLIEDMKKYYGKTVEKEDALERLNEWYRAGFGTYEVVGNDIVHFEIEEDDEWYEYVKNRNKDIPRKEVPLDVLEDYYDEKEPKDTKELKLIREFLLENLGGESHGAVAVSMVMEDLHDYLVADGELSDFMTILEDRHMIFDIDQTTALLQLIIDARNNTILWGNNGWTPKELSVKNRGRKGHGRTREAYAPYQFGEPEQPQPYVAPKKVGRNELCPCGSGKKYKHCCMLKDN